MVTKNILMDFYIILKNKKIHHTRPMIAIFVYKILQYNHCLQDSWFILRFYKATFKFLAKRGEGGGKATTWVET